VAFQSFLPATTPFCWCGLFYSLFAHSFLVKREIILAYRLALGCKVSGRDILHEREMAQPVLFLAIIDIHDLPRSGFVLTSCFLGLMWGKVDLI